MAAVPPGTYNLIWPVERALAIQSRSRVLKGTSTKLTLAGRFLALSGYMKWCVVRPPTSPSKPTVGAWFILGTEAGAGVLRDQASPQPGHGGPNFGPRFLNPALTS